MPTRPKRPRRSAARTAELVAAGFSPAALRGHARPGERSVSGRLPKADLKLKAAIERVKSGDSLTAVAKDLHISRERLRAGVAQHGHYRRHGRRYRFEPPILSDMPLYSDGASIRVVVDEENASRLGAFMAATGKFFSSNDTRHLAPFVSKGVTEAKGKFHPFETDPEVLYELRAKGRAVFHQIYQLSN